MKPQVLDKVTVMGSIIASAVESWNKIQKQLKNILLKDLSTNNIKTGVSNFHLKLH